MAFVKIPESTMQVKLVELTDNCIDKIADAVVRKLADRKTEPTISKMEQVDKDINVRSKDESQTATLYDQIVEDIEIRVKCANAKKIEDEPQTNADQHVQRVESVETMSCQECKHWDCLINADWKCTLKECNYEPKDEPKTQMKTQNSNLTFEKTDEPQSIIGESFPSYITEDRTTQVLDGWQANPRTSTTAVEDEPQTDCAWGKHE